MTSNADPQPRITPAGSASPSSQMAIPAVRDTDGPTTAAIANRRREVQVSRDSGSAGSFSHRHPVPCSQKRANYFAKLYGCKMIYQQTGLNRHK